VYFAATAGGATIGLDRSFTLVTNHIMLNILMTRTITSRTAYIVGYIQVGGLFPYQNVVCSIMHVDYLFFESTRKACLIFIEEEAIQITRSSQLIRT
jgi:hypothetical protein